MTVKEAHPIECISTGETLYCVDFGLSLTQSYFHLLLILEPGLTNYTLS